jgi:hypothetical protein
MRERKIIKAHSLSSCVQQHRQSVVFYMEVRVYEQRGSNEQFSLMFQFKIIKFSVRLLAQGYL